VPVQVGVGANRRAGGDPSEYGNLQHFRAWRAFHQANAAGLVGHHFDQPGFGKRHDMLARHAAGGEAEGLGNLGKARWLALRDDAFADEIEDRATARSEFVHGVYLYSFGRILTSAVDRNIVV